MMRRCIVDLGQIVTSSSAASICSTISPPRFGNRLVFQIPLAGVNVRRSGRLFTSFRSTFAVRSTADSGESLGTPESPTSVPVRVAHELVQAGHHYLDVRTPEEFHAGHVAGAVNIPYMNRVGLGMSKNPKFVEEVSARFGIYDEIVVGCQVGKRSMMAATDLLAAGFTGVTDVAGGFTAWIQNGLPIER